MGAGSGEVMVERWRDPTWWSTERVPPSRQFDVWCDFVTHAHSTWAIPRPRLDRFPAYMREGRSDDCRVAHVTCGRRVMGARGLAEIAKDREALYSVCYVAEGSERLGIEGREIELREGQFMLWDSTRPMTFVTGDHLRQVSFGAPHHRIERVLPNAADFIGRPIDGRRGAGRMFASHLLSLDANFGELERTAAPRMMEATIGLLAATLDASFPALERNPAPTLLTQVQSTILRRLGDPRLCLSEIAAECGITLRHLHRLFEQTDTSASAWIRRRRLDGCRRDLASPTQDHVSITAIAYRWGFLDSSTFSRVFRREFGSSPREFRAAH